VFEGGAGADVFLFRVAEYFAPADRVLDFRPGKGDLIDLSPIDANVNTLRDEPFRFVTAFTGQAGEAVLSYDAANNRTLLLLNVDADNLADITIVLDGQVTAEAGGFVL
jgi:serralysin